MSFCIKCGGQFMDGVDICPHCGALQEVSVDTGSLAVPSVRQQNPPVMPVGTVNQIPQPRQQMPPYGNGAYNQPVGNYNQPNGAYMGNGYQQPMGNQSMGNQPMGGYPQQNAMYQQPMMRQRNEGMVTAIKVFMILGTIAEASLVLPLAWCIPMTVSVFHSLNDGRPISPAMKVCTLLFVSRIGGICMLASSDL